VLPRLLPLTASVETLVKPGSSGLFGFGGMQVPDFVKNGAGRDAEAAAPAVGNDSQDAATAAPMAASIRSASLALRLMRVLLPQQDSAATRGVCPGLD